MARAPKADPDRTPDPRWPLRVGLFVWIGMAATVALAFIESWWG
jgi:hypothetical protein